MLADDILGRRRERYEQPLPVSYTKVFQAITSDRLDQFILPISKIATSPIRNPVENMNSNRAFSIGETQASRKCLISISVKNLGIRLPNA